MADAPSAHTAPHVPANPWPHRLALVTCAATFILILFGGLVTGLGAGLAVPDWPSTFGHNMFLFPPTKMVGGIFYEHTHRLIGSLAGLSTASLAVALWLWERRRWLRWLGTAALLTIIGQGVLGGLRVVWLSDNLAMVHGIVAQSFFALVAGLAVVTAKAWHRAEPCPHQGALGAIQRWALLTAGTAYLQVVFGAVLTHTGSRLDAHLTFAAALSALVVLLARRVLAEAGRWPRLAQAARALHAVWGLQLLLGAAAYVVRFQPGGVAVGLAAELAVRVAHRLTGALVLAAAVAVAAWACRLRGAAAPAESDDGVPGRVAA
ncbi:MAG: COX15/CtaA family protein [candidate division NC10 bacterium]|nr:COX15/CtaA family protein [candidate division NC10 bacterium]